MIAHPAPARSVADRCRLAARHSRVLLNIFGIAVHPRADVTVLMSIPPRSTIKRFFNRSRQPRQRPLNE